MDAPVATAPARITSRPPSPENWRAELTNPVTNHPETIELYGSAISGLGNVIRQTGVKSLGEDAIAIASEDALGECLTIYYQQIATPDERADIIDPLNGATGRGIYADALRAINRVAVNPGRTANGPADQSEIARLLSEILPTDARTNRPSGASVATEMAVRIAQNYMMLELRNSGRAKAMLEQLRQLGQKRIGHADIIVEPVINMARAIVGSFGDRLPASSSIGNWTRDSFDRFASRTVPSPSLP